MEVLQRRECGGGRDPSATVELSLQDDNFDLIKE
jgi:hypothetical protein